MKIWISSQFKRISKKLHAKELVSLKKAIEEIKQKPKIGELKKGDLTGIRVYKFYIAHQLILLAYLLNEKEHEITLVSFAPHENFYTDLKKHLKSKH